MTSLFAVMLKVNRSGVSAIVLYVEYVGEHGGFMSGVSTLESND